MAKTIYIIHGWTYTTKLWEPVIKGLQDSGLRVKMLRVPGLTAKSDEVWTINGYVEWLRQELRGVEKPVLLGHSNGGRIALNYDIKYPGSLSRLVLLNSAGVYDSSTKTSLKRKVFGLMAKLLGPLKYIPLLKKVVYRLIGASDYNSAPPNMKQTLANMIESDRELDLTKVSVETVLLWGSKDTTTPIAQGRKMQQMIAGAELTEFEDWKHSPYITQPSELVSAITKVMESK